ncbi:MAG: hypothetical protein HRT61_24100 [Ekhidna sp.]|nr:hypothetical protein [Ekhidna sp.]
MKVKDHNQFTDDELEQKFETYRLKPGMFSHEAHLRLAYIHIVKYGAKQAEINMVNQIKGYAEFLGVFDKFNKTVTIASVKTMHHFISKSNGNSFKELTSSYPELLNDFKGILKKHYSFNVFADKQAKLEFIQPDLLPFQSPLETNQNSQF